MSDSTILEQLRTTFREAYEVYIREGYEMRDLLTSDGLGDSERQTAIQERQNRVDEAKQRYEEARSAYVTYVLGTLAGSGGKIL